MGLGRIVCLLHASGRAPVITVMEVHTPALKDEAGDAVLEHHQWMLRAGNGNCFKRAWLVVAFLMPKTVMAAMLCDPISPH